MNGEEIKTKLPLDAVKSTANYVIFSNAKGVLSEHDNLIAATLAFYACADKIETGENLPRIYRREQDQWKAL